MITSKLSIKAQTTVPQAVRTALSLKGGDQIGYAIREGEVVMLRVEPAPERLIDWDPFATFWEWRSEEDREDFDGD